MTEEITMLQNLSAKISGEVVMGEKIELLNIFHAYCIRPTGLDHRYMQNTRNGF